MSQPTPEHLAAAIDVQHRETWGAHLYPWSCRKCLDACGLPYSAAEAARLNIHPVCPSCGSLHVDELLDTWRDRLRAHRLRAGLSQEHLATLLGWQAPRIGMYERGQRTPKATMAARLADKLDAPDLNIVWPL